MLFTCNQCVAVGRNSFTTKSGQERYSITFANGNGEPVRLSCDVTSYANVVPMGKRYEISANFDTNGYDIYGELLSIKECKAS